MIPFNNPSGPGVEMSQSQSPSFCPLSVSWLWPIAQLRTSVRNTAVGLEASMPLSPWSKSISGLKDKRNPPALLQCYPKPLRTNIEDGPGAWVSLETRNAGSGGIPSGLELTPSHSARGLNLCTSIYPLMRNPISQDLVVILCQSKVSDADFVPSWWFNVMVGVGWHHCLRTVRIDNKKWNGNAH